MAKAGPVGAKFEDCYYEAKDGCWVWDRYRNYKGYGTFRGEFSHRYSYSIYKGEIPLGAQVQHTCDYPSCVNPDHLILGNNQENVDRKMALGRYVIPRPMTETLPCRCC